jgi:hypothetical protein
VGVAVAERVGWAVGVGSAIVAAAVLKSARVCVGAEAAVRTLATVAVWFGVVSVGARLAFPLQEIRSKRPARNHNRRRMKCAL